MAADELLELRTGLKDLAAQLMEQSRTALQVEAKTAESLAAIRSDLASLREQLVAIQTMIAEVRNDYRDLSARVRDLENDVAKLRGGGIAIKDWITPIAVLVLAALQVWVAFR